MRLYYAFNDANADDRDYSEIALSNAYNINNKGYGIFWTVNSFKGSRKIENLTHINSWFVDIDFQKDKLDDLIAKSPLYPSLVVETKRGYHLYFNAKNATLTNYKLINKRLLEYFGKGEKSVFDVARLLRVPGYNHLKDPANPFLIKTVFEMDVTYSEELILYILKKHPDEIKPKIVEHTKFVPTGDSFWDTINLSNQEDLLKSISGKSCVNFESYTFKNVGANKKNIFVNDLPTSCWVDSSGLIGSHGSGGPTVIQWLMYFGHTKKEAVDILKDNLGITWLDLIAYQIDQKMK